MKLTPYTSYTLRALQLAAPKAPYLPRVHDTVRLNEGPLDLALADIASNRNDLLARIAPLERGIPTPKRST